MAFDISSYDYINFGIFVRINCTQYRTTPSGSYTTQVLRFSDINRPITVNSEVYTGLGKLLSVTSSTSELKVSGSEVSVTISGIPNTSIAEIVNSKIKGSEIKIYRGVLNNPSAGGGLLSTSGNPFIRFSGIITNYSLNEEYDVDTRNASNTIVLNCASTVEVLSQKLSGRRTNPENQKELYPSDLSFDRIPSLVGQYFDFGVKQ